MTRVLLLSKSDALRCRVAHCLGAAGIELDVIARERTSLAFSRHVRKFSITRFPDGEAPTPEFIDLVNEYVAANEIECVMAGDVRSVLLLCNLKSHIVGAACFPLSSSETIKLLNDKMRFNRFLQENELPAPPSVLLREREDVFGRDIATLTFPLIAKPLDMQAGRGVVRVDTLDQLADHVFGNNPYNELPLIVQHYEPGMDGGCSVLADKGQVLAYVQQYYAADGAITFFRDDKILGVVKRIVQLTEFTGLANFDMRFTEDLQLRAIIECNPRFWYSIPAAMVHGINFAKAGIELAINTAPADRWQSAYRAGRYYPFRAALRHGVKGLFGARDGMVRDNFHELWRETSDFLPLLYNLYSTIAHRK